MNDEPSTDINLTKIIDKIPSIIDQNHVDHMINLQTHAIDRLEATNKNLESCHAHAQERLATVTKLFKKASRQISDSKRDLDIIYKKLSEMKSDRS